MTVQITIIGLNQIGASFGLALADHKDEIFRVGVERRPDASRKAEKIGAVDKMVINLPASVEKADIVLLSMPVDEVRETLKVIKLDLKEGAVVIDTSPVKVAAESWAKEMVPENRYFVSMTPTLNPAYIEETDTSIDAAHADLFKQGLMLITAPQGTDESAVRLAADLATLVGSKPLFSDPLEAEGLLAGVHLLPRLTSAALLMATIDQPGWSEARKVAGKTYASATAAATTFDESKMTGQSIMLNPANTVRVINNLIDALVTLRDYIIDENAEELQKALEHARQARADWLKQRRSAEWGTVIEQPIPTAGEMIGRLIGLGGRREPKTPKERK